MNENSIIIHQTLHGYSNGHHLLEASILLSDDSKRKMDILSDLSGTDVTDGFDFYYSGYLLENEELVVLSKTWYAPEMSRPGCVWTHSLLIPIKDLAFCAANINALLTKFKRPGISESQTKYSESLVIDTHEDILQKYDDKKIQYLIWIMIGQTPPNYIVAKDSEEFIKELLFIWFMCYSELIYDYSFITGTSFIKSDNSNLISLQFCSKQVRNKLSHLSSNITLMKSIDDVQKFPQWVINTHAILINGEWSKFLAFKELLCDGSLSEVSLTSFIKLYSCFYNEKNSIDIYASLELIDKLFREDRSIIGNKLLELYFQGAFQEWGVYTAYSNIVIATIKFHWIDVLPETLELLIQKGFSTDFIGSKKIVQYLVKIDDSPLQEKYLPIYASLLSPSSFEDFSDMDYSVCNVLIAINSTLAECDAIWKQSRGFQHGILNSLQICKKENRLDNKVLRIILDASEFDFSGEIYNIWGEASISVFLEYLLGIEYLRHNDTSKMVELCKQHSHIAANLFEIDLERFNLEQIFELMKIVNPFTDKLSSKRLISAYSLFDINSLNEYQKNEMADFYLPFIICSKDMFPYEIVSFAVTNVHYRLSKLAYPEEKWEKLQRSLPPVTVFNQWDRCKRLRKAIKKKGYDIKLLNKYNDNELNIHLL
ncbi:GAP1-N1 domain-containing protein [Clostridium sp. ZS2-4]|uniref:GAP1-N1 domain-containing protein n=1 Tax=Clostridium sp. ZS2-4 TaxID=2987703 RepID=UPI00227C5F29|nr:hypothetical protein [Clostridium sp. ZS2-4]MCY6356007.1 hypothetical protein [Clostridium sp. ZS2-4]